jgi:hypothetical protein
VREALLEQSGSALFLVRSVARLGEKFQIPSTKYQGNPKSEYRNPKQIEIREIQRLKTKREV